MNSFRLQHARLEVWRDPAELCERAAELFIGIAREAEGTGADFTVALSGGSTPKSLYALLATEAKAARVPWEQAQIFWSDERCVPPDDEQSNYRMAYQALLAHVPVLPERIHRMHGEDLPAHAAEAYAAELEKQFGAEGDPRFSLILLGMGEDGHTASLFPHAPALEEREKTVVAAEVEKLRAHRLTFTLRTINAAAQVIFLVSGAAKAATLKAVLEDDSTAPGALPAQLVRPEGGELIWLVDEDAAQLLKG